MKTEELLALGLTEEQVTKVLTINSKDIEKFKNTNDSMKTELAGLHDQLKTANETIEGFKKLDVDGIKKAAQEWKDKHAADTAALTEKLKQQSRDAAIRLAVAHENVHDDALTVAALDLNKITVADDGTITGLSDQLTALRESKPFLFKTGEMKHEYTPNGGNPPQADLDKMSDAEWFAVHSQKN
ncbi:phage scaffolding protein [Anaerotruncus rubiinfantis]|uniref:phage scaffolding protein n=1 Tax=Anaerotruncus rubiinfantis TaxID=1720200 RepID=UPI00083545C0|nr:phage scaffolding protein [Anaerotruncus rubiinfantis]